MTIPTKLLHGLKVPVVVAPMLLISNPALVIAACKAGAIGTFPALNQRTTQGFEAWIDEIEAALGPDDAAYGVNLIVSPANTRLKDDLEVVVRRRVPLVITSFGADNQVVDAVHAYGGIVFHDIASARHAAKAARSGVDGLILLTAGAGGHTGWMNPFALINEVRAVFDGTVLLAGALSTGADIAAAEVAGADLAYMGTRFIATSEAPVEDAYRDMRVAGDGASVVVTRGMSGTPASFLRPSLEAHGLDPDAMATRTAAITEAEAGRPIKPWKEIWSAGQGIGSIGEVTDVATLVAQLADERQAALARAASLADGIAR